MAEPLCIVGPRGQKLYASPKEHPGKYRRSGGLPRDIKMAISPTDWAEQVELSARLCSRIPSLRGAIRQKSEWAFAGDSWQPIYYGAHAAWGEIVEDWLTRVVFPNALRGNVRKDLIKAMQVSGMGWDIHGDDLALFMLGKGNMPQMRIVPGTCIGNGPESKSGAYGWTSTVSGGVYQVGSYALNGYGTCVGGRYDGYRIYNGVIIDDEEEPIAARVVGLKRDGGKWVETFADFDLGFQHGTHMASEYEWHGMGRPLPRLAASILQWMNKEQVDQNFMKGIDLMARQTVIHKLAPNQDAGDARGDAAQIIETTDADGNTQQILVDTVEAGDVKYISSGEDLAGLNYENPHPNVEDFAKRIVSECLSDLGWPYELTNLSSTGRAPTRLSCELANNSQWQKQCTGEARLFGFVKYAIGVGITHGHIPKPPAGPPEEPYKWTFGYPKEMSVDQGNDVKAMLDMLRFGLTSQRITSSKWGYVQKRIRQDRRRENMGLIDDAAELVKYAKEKHSQDLPFQKAIELFYQPGANPAAIPAPKPADNNAGGAATSTAGSAPSNNE